MPCAEKAPETPVSHGAEKPPPGMDAAQKAALEDEGVTDGEPVMDTVDVGVPDTVVVAVVALDGDGDRVCAGEGETGAPNVTLADDEDEPVALAEPVGVAEGDAGV